MGRKDLVKAAGTGSDGTGRRKLLAVIQKEGGANRVEGDHSNLDYNRKAGEAHSATETANATGTPDDHQAAADAHTSASNFAKAAMEHHEAMADAHKKAC